MADLFSELSSMGISGLDGVKIFEEEKKPVASDEAKAAAQQVNEEDLLFDKKVQCPVCDKDFKSRTVKTGKSRLIGSDTDLRPRYQGVDPIKYEVIACPHCGYAAMSRFFSYMTSAQAKFIKESVSANFKGLPEMGNLVSYDEAIGRYKLALYNTVVKKAKLSERAYTCLKIAWLYRGKVETLPEDTADIAKIKEECYKAELEFIANAYEGFTNAMSKELFPICGMDENTFNYLLADLARRIGKFDDSSKLISRILTSSTATPKLKDKARDLRDLMKKK